MKGETRRREKMKWWKGRLGAEAWSGMLMGTVSMMRRTVIAKVRLWEELIVEMSRRVHLRLKTKN